MSEPVIPAYEIVAEKIRQISPDVQVADVIPFNDRGVFTFQLRVADRQCEVEFSEEFLEDLRDFTGNKNSAYWKQMEQTLVSKLTGPMEHRGVIPFTKETLKRLIFEHVKQALQSTSHLNKYNLIGRPYQAGSLEGFLKVKFRDDERACAGQAFDELRQQGVLVPTYTDLISPEDWVKLGKVPINQSGGASPSAEIVENDQQPVRVADLEKVGEIPIKGVFLSSTLENLRDCRAEVIKELEKHNVKVVHSGSHEFAGIPPDNVYDICLYRVQTTPIFVLIVDESYGDLYGGKRHEEYQDVSITHAELRTALADDKKPVLVYVRDTVWEHYKLWRDNPDLKCGTDPRVFKMLKEFQDTGQWITPFGDSVHLKHMLLGRLGVT